MMKRNLKKSLSLLLAIMMALSVLSINAFAVIDNDHDRISVDTASPLTVQWESNNPDVAAYHEGNIVSDTSDYYPASFYLYVDRAAANGISISGGTISGVIEETEGGSKYLVTHTTAGTITIQLANPAHSGSYVLTFEAAKGEMPSGAITGTFQGYLPLGQYARGSAWGSPYSNGTTLDGTTPKILGGFSSTGVSLGAGGGYVQYELSDYISDDPTNPYGVDFIVYGNAFNGNPEAGSVQVSEDGTTWYELAGSLYYDSNTIRNATITYTLNGSNIDYSITAPGREAMSGTFKTNGSSWFPTQANYSGVWKIGNADVIATTYNANTITYSGVTLVKDTDTTNDYQFGYADVHVNGGSYGTAINPYTATNTSQGGDGFDIAWAVKADGTPAGITRIKYIRVYTSALMNANASAPTVPSIFGETSTEVCGIYAVTGTGSGNRSSVMILNEDNDNIANIMGTTLVSAGSYYVISDAANVYVNGTRVTATEDDPYTIDVDPGALVQVIAQNGTDSPVLTVLQCR